MSLRESIKAGVTSRLEFPLRADKVALLIIDIQAYLAPTTDCDTTRNNVEQDQFSQAHARTVKNIAELTQAFRQVRDAAYQKYLESNDEHKGTEVIWTFLQTATKDGRDMSLDYKVSGSLLANIPRSDYPFNQLFLPECHPDTTNGKGDILLPKTSCSVFQSTNLDYLLRNLQIEQLVICGQVTDQCVESAVRDAADLGYLVTVAQDACAAHTLESHAKGLHGMTGFCRILNTDEVIKELKASSESMLSERPLGPLDRTVLKYLRDKGMEDAAHQLQGILNKR